MFEKTAIEVTPFIDINNNTFDSHEIHAAARVLLPFDLTKHGVSGEIQLERDNDIDLYIRLHARQRLVYPNEL
jgi:hypothetical protein